MANKLKHKVDRDFTVTPNIILKDSSVSLKAKGLWVQLISLSEDWNFSLAGLAKLTKDNETSISSGIRELVDNGYLKWEKIKDSKGRFTVVVTTLLPEVSPHGKTPHGKTPHGKNSVNKETKNKEQKNKENKQVTNVTGDTAIGEVASETYGHSDINEMHEYWEHTTGMAVVANKQKNRYACSNLLKKHGTEDLKRLIQGVAMAIQDTYAPRIYDFVSLQAKTNELILWGRKKGESNNAAANF